MMLTTLPEARVRVESLRYEHEFPSFVMAEVTSMKEIPSLPQTRLP